MADPIADLHMVLTTCGVSVEATRTLIINIKSLTLITDFGFLDGGNDDVTAMSLHMLHCVSNNGRVILGGIQINKIKSVGLVGQVPPEVRTAYQCGLMDGCSDDERWHCQAYRKGSAQGGYESRGLKGVQLG